MSATHPTGAIAPKQTQCGPGPSTRPNRSSARRMQPERTDCRRPTAGTTNTIEPARGPSRNTVAAKAGVDTHARTPTSRVTSASAVPNAGGVTMFVQDKECQDMRQLRARLDDLRKKFQVCVVENLTSSLVG